MPITSSQNTIDAHQQADGSRYCKQVCTDAVGGIHQRTVNLAPGNDGVALLAQYVIDLDKSLQSAEFRAVLKRVATIILNHLTKEQFAALFWETLKQTYLDGDRREYHFMIWWLYDRVSAGDFTSNEVRLTFNDAYGRSLNPSQWTSFTSARLAPIRDRYQAMLDEADL